MAVTSESSKHKQSPPSKGGFWGMSLRKGELGGCYLHNAHKMERALATNQLQQQRQKADHREATI